MKRDKIQSKPLVIFLLLFLFFPIYFIYRELKSNDQYIRGVINKHEQWILANNDLLSWGIEEIFHYASTCSTIGGVTEDCTRRTRYLVDYFFGEILEVDWSQSRKPIYFIRLNNNGDIEKIYQSGDYTLEKVNTKGEKFVAIATANQIPGFKRVNLIRFGN